MKRILVAGGSGFIGSHTVIELHKSGFQPVIVDNLDNSSAICVERLETILQTKIEFHLIDLCNIDSVRLLFQKAGPFHAVIHFAGLKAVGESCDIPLKYYQNNLACTFNLLEVMEAHNCCNLIFSSSATVYGFAAPPITESAPLQATNPYGRTKLFIEEILRDVGKGKSGSRWKIVILRYFNPVGAHASGLIGEDPHGIPNNLMPFIQQVCVGRRPHLNVFGNDYDTPDGTGVRDYIHVVDLAEGHVAALQHVIFPSAEPQAEHAFANVEVFNLGSGSGVSVLQMIHAMEKASGKEVPYKIASRRAGDVAQNFADASKANTLLKWRCTRSLEQMCEDAWRWQQKNPFGFKGKE